MKANGKGKGRRSKRALSTTPRSCHIIWLDTSSDSDVQGNFSESDVVQGGPETESDEELDDGTVHSPIEGPSSRRRPV